jgi:hypothetical protein
VWGWGAAVIFTFAVASAALVYGRPLVFVLLAGFAAGLATRLGRPWREHRERRLRDRGLLRD